MAIWSRPDSHGTGQVEGTLPKIMIVKCSNLHHNWGFMHGQWVGTRLNVYIIITMHHVPLRI